MYILHFAERWNVPWKQNIDKMTRKIKKMYICVGKDQKGFAQSVTDFINSLARQSHCEQHISGGGSGDLHQETATITTYHMEDGWIQLYTVTDDSTNGYGECVSVLWEPPTKIDEKFSSWPEFVEFLDEHDFVPKHKSLKERPEGWKSFASYLDSEFSRPSIAPFTTEKGRG